MRRPSMYVDFGTGGSANVNEFSLVHNEFEHETVVLEVPRATAEAKRFVSGTTVRVLYGFPQQIGTFVGYVSHVDPGYSNKRRREESRSVRVVLMGPSYGFKGGGFYNGRSVSAATAVRHLAEAKRFQVTARQHAALGNFAQGGRSDWAFMVDLAKKCGYTLIAHGTSLYFCDRTMMLSLVTTTPSLLVPRGVGGAMAEFTSSIGQGAPRGGQTLRRVVNGVDPRTGRTFVAASSAPSSKAILNSRRLAPVFTGGLTGTVDSMADASTLLDGHGGTNQLAVQATATIIGNARVQVGGAVQVLGVDSVNDGYWYVHGLTHEMKDAEFLTHLRLGREGESGFALPKIPSATRSVRSSRLVNNQWVQG